MSHKCLLNRQCANRIIRWCVRSGLLCVAGIEASLSRIISDSIQSHLHVHHMLVMSISPATVTLTNCRVTQPLPCHCTQRTVFGRNITMKLRQVKSSFLASCRCQHGDACVCHDGSLALPRAISILLPDMILSFGFFLF